MSDLITFDAYFAQFGGEIGIPDNQTQAELKYKFSIAAARADLQDRLYVQKLADALEAAGAAYHGGSDLLYLGATTPELQIKTKPYESVLSKIYRSNVVQNRRYPKEPPKGWTSFTNIYSTVNDLLRTRVVCKYLDGPQFVAKHIEEFCLREGLQFSMHSMATDLGYHAWHVYIAFPLYILIDSDVQETPVRLEVQLTTQLAEVIASLTHGLYEGKRELRPQRNDNGWRWEPDSQEFRSAYLGHTLHLLEGVIQTFKNDVLSPASANRDSPIVDSFESVEQTPAGEIK